MMSNLKEKAREKLEGLDDLLKTLGPELLLAASLYAAAQFGVYNSTQNQLKEHEAINGVPATVQMARQELQGNTSPIAYLTLPGYKLALVNYIDEHSNNATR